MYMNDWKNEVENALRVFHYDVLEGKGKISHKQAKKKQKVSMKNTKLFKTIIMYLILIDY